jgi:hypothetical protein
MKTLLLRLPDDIHSQLKDFQIDKVTRRRDTISLNSIIVEIISKVTEKTTRKSEAHKTDVHSNDQG